MTMKTQTLDPLISEFAIDDPRPSVPHDEAMARVRATIQAAKRKPKSA